MSASWLSGNAFVSGTGASRFKSLAGQIGHCVANGSQLLQHFERSCVACSRNDPEIVPPNSLRASASTIKDLSWSKRLYTVYCNASILFFLIQPFQRYSFLSSSSCHRFLATLTIWAGSTGINYPCAIVTHHWLLPATVVPRLVMRKVALHAVL